MGNGFEHLVKGLVSDETSDLERSVDILNAIVCDAQELIWKYFARSRRISTDGYRELVAQIDETVVSEIRPVRRKITIRPPTAARPKSEAHELLYLFALPETRPGRSNFFRLTSLRVVTNRKKVIMEFMPTHLAIRGHAAARFIERGADCSTAVRLLASSVADWAAMPSIVDEAIEGAGYSRLALPCRLNGMLMGYVDSSEALPAGRRHSFDKHRFASEPIAASPLTPMTFIVNTYIGRAEIHDNQLGAMCLLEEWRRAAGSAFDAACEDAFWPVRELSPVSPGIDNEIAERMREEIVMPRMLRAMGNKVPMNRDDEPRLADTFEDYCDEPYDVQVLTL